MKVVDLHPRAPKTGPLMVKVVKDFGHWTVSYFYPTGRLKWRDWHPNEGAARIACSDLVASGECTAFPGVRA